MKLIITLCLIIPVKLNSSEKMLEEAGVESDSSQQDPDTFLHSDYKKLQAIAVDANTESSEKMLEEAGVESDSSQQDPDTSSHSDYKKLQATAVDANTERKVGKAAAKPTEAANATNNIPAGNGTAALKAKHRNLFKPRRLAAKLSYFELYKGGIQCFRNINSKKSTAEWKEECAEDITDVYEECCDEGCSNKEFTSIFGGIWVQSLYKGDELRKIRYCTDEVKAEFTSHREEFD